jgi:hypothetical protein
VNPPNAAAPHPPSGAAASSPARSRQQQSAAVRARLRFTGWKLYGMLAGAFSVVLASYAMSFESLRHLAQLIGWGDILSCGLPVILDVYAAVASLFWFGFGAASEKVRRDAMVNTVFSGVLSVAGNALLHVMLTGTFVSEVEKTAPVSDLPEFNGVHFFNVNPVIAVLVGMVPPIINVSVVHLLSKFALEVDEFDAAAIDTARPAVPATRSASVVRRDEPVVATGRVKLTKDPLPAVGAVNAGPARQALPAPAAPAAPAPVQRPAARTAPTPKPAVASIGEATSVRERAAVELARRAAAGIDITAKGTNQQVATTLGISLRSAESGAALYKKNPDLYVQAVERLKATG